MSTQRPANAPLTGGTLERIPLAEIVRTLFVERSTCQVLLSKGGEERTLSFDRGQLVSASSNREAQQVGDLLRNFGLADQKLLFTAFEKALSEPGRGLAKALKETGAVPAYVADACVRALAEKVLFDSFRWGGGVFTVTALEKAPSPPVRFDQGTGSLVLEGLRRLPADAPRGAARIDPKSRPVLAPDLLLRYQVVSLLPEEAEVLSRSDGVRSAAEASTDLAVLERLRAIGLVQLVPPGQTPPAGARVEWGSVLNVDVIGGAPPPRAAEQLERQVSLIWNTYRRIDWATHYDVLGVAQGATEDEVGRALHERARLFHPDHASRAPLNDARDALETLFRKLRQAERALTEPERRSAYDATLAGAGQVVSVEGGSGVATLQLEIAKKNYLRARQLFEQEDYYPAYEMVRQAVEFDPEKPEYWVLLSRIQRKNPKWVRQASETLRRAIGKVPESVDLWYELSEAYAAERNENERVKALKEVLKLDSTNRRAQAALAEIASMKPGKG